MPAQSIIQFSEPWDKLAPCAFISEPSSKDSHSLPASVRSAD